ncbi:Response regulator containing a CheY-like protein receiver domain and a GGDEF domain-like protein [Shewanella sediminis HAW-EB3]|uniref:Response regulator containing a CheY-like protein receiver domain and a GGDEF domain-like protein n=1 Tax=Shewanella sediminis (strain HAW-EB3) TaxID=425104 RepID=A8FT21_SHESH|nr:response regulator [Shewanella sediminis]ABV35994.1 Response regulator containing a CheY-like protein receiver domain and a GGDEF domain-like protein [Shewanella sediminis HAW-EB3]
MKPVSNILIVDDTAISRLILRGMLEDKYRVTEADNGETCLAMVKDSIPDLLLLDVDMPGLTGYEVCVALRKESATANLPIIFVSALDTVEERLAGFEAGADEYIVKPAEPEALNAKVDTCLERYLEVFNAEKSALEATEIAMEAMTVSSELGQVVNFIKDVQSIEHPHEVGLAIIRILRNFGMNSVARIDTGSAVFVDCGEESIEAQVLSRFVVHSERILSVGIRTVIRAPHIVLLIKDMPLDDEKRCGRFRDHIAVLMDIAGAHLATLKAREEMVEQRQNIFTQVIAVAEKQLELTTERLFEHDRHSQGIMHSMVNQLEGMLFGLGLEEDQEKQLMALADQTSLKIEETQGETQVVSRELGTILESLYDFFNTLNDNTPRDDVYDSAYEKTEHNEHSSPEGNPADMRL